MKLLFAGEVYEMVPQNSGIVFSYKKGTVDDNVIVSYKMLSLEMGTFSDVAKNIYLLAKFGSNYRIAEHYSENYVTEKSIVMPSGKAFICSKEGRAALIGENIEPDWVGEIKYRGEAPSDIVLYKNGLWASFASSGVLLRFNLSTMREELRIGGKNSPFEAPNDIFIDGNTAVISSKKSPKLVKVNLDSYMVEDYLEFGENVYSYAKVQGYEFILTESGVYVI